MPRTSAKRKTDDLDPRLRLEKSDKVKNYWSASAWNVYAGCPRAYFLDRIKKLCPFTGNAATRRGDMIHRKMEAYLKGKTTGGVPDELKNLAKELTMAKKLGAVAEGSWTLTVDEKKTSATDWDGAWLRAKVDMRLALDAKGKGLKADVKKADELMIVDLKSGRPKPQPAQREIYAGMSIFWIKAKKVITELWHCDEPVDSPMRMEPIEFTGDEAIKLWEKWKARGLKMLADRAWNPTPGNACDRCQYASNKTMVDGSAGPCDAWKLGT